MRSTSVPLHACTATLLVEIIRQRARERPAASEPKARRALELTPGISQRAVR